MRHIGILQLTQHLDDAVQGFKAGLTANGLTAQFDYLCSDGNTALLAGLARDLEVRGVDLIFACSTPAAKAAMALSADIPVVFTPVFDPVGAGLVAALDNPGGKGTGMAGMVSASAKLAFIHELLPEAKTVAVLYHSSDSNSLLEVSHFTAAAEGLYHVTLLAVDQPQELSLLGERLTGSVDALFLPIGKVVEENFATVVYYADLAAIPIIASNGANVPAGALAALAADHYKLGVACAAQAVKILAGTAPGSIAVGSVETPDILLNNYAARNLGIEFAPALAAKAKEIFE